MRWRRKYTGTRAELVREGEETRPELVREKETRPELVREGEETKPELVREGSYVVEPVQS